MKMFSAVIEQDLATGIYVGFVPGFPGAHSQGGTPDELQHNLRGVIAMLLEDGEPVPECRRSLLRSPCAAVERSCAGRRDFDEPHKLPTEQLTALGRYLQTC